MEREGKEGEERKDRQSRVFKGNLRQTGRKILKPDTKCSYYCANPHVFLAIHESIFTKMCPRPICVRFVL